MSDRPILFSAPMVRALLDGRKTQTRRVIKPQPSDDIVRVNGYWFDHARGVSGKEITRFMAGDRLWVRETWQDVAEGYLTIYRADYPACVPPRFENVPALDELNTPWRPSIFMPRKASRLTLVVTDVRVERLQSISEVDAEAEGIEFCSDLDPLGNCKWRHYTKPNTGIWPPSASYETLWNSINGAGAWDANPWVVAVSFTVHRGNIDQVTP